MLDIKTYQYRKISRYVHIAIHAYINATNTCVYTHICTLSCRAVCFAIKTFRRAAASAGNLPICKSIFIVATCLRVCVCVCVCTHLCQRVCKGMDKKDPPFYSTVVHIDKIQVV